MLEREKLRKADVFTGLLFFLFGLWILSRAVQMPMKDSWGGVQNVWYVSPALFPLFVGAMISLLGAMLVIGATRTVGKEGVKGVLTWLASPSFLAFLKAEGTIRFYAISTLLLSYVFIFISRIDFFICSILFLIAFTCMFYLEEKLVLKKALVFYLTCTMGLLVFFIFNLAALLGEPLQTYAADILAIFFLCSYGLYIRLLVGGAEDQRKKYTTCLIVSLVTPFVLGPIFKYFLLVPLPFEGLVVSGLDAIWYSFF